MTSDLHAKSSVKAKHYLEVRETLVLGKWMDLRTVTCDHPLPPEQAERNARSTKVIDETTCSECVAILLARGCSVRNHKPASRGHYT